MLVLRLFRVGKRNQPSFKIVVTDKRNPTRAGRFVEEVGFYNPVTKEKVIRKERVQYWLSKGVQPSPTVFNLLVKDGIVEGKKISVHKKSKPAQGGSASGGKPTAEAVATVVPTVAPASVAPAPAETVPAAEPSKEVPKTEQQAGPIAQR